MATEKPKKRRSSFGRLEHRRDRGKWAVKLPTGEQGPTGRPKYRVKLYDTKREAEKELRKARGLHMAGRLVVEPREAPEEPKDAPLSLVAAIDEYITGKKGEAADKTLESYLGIRNVIAFEESPLAAVTVEDLDARTIEAYREWRREHVFRVIAPPVEGVDPKMEHRKGAVASNATINRDVTLIKSALNRLVRLKALDENPAAVVKAGKEREKLPVALADEEAVRLLASCRDDFRPIVKTALYTGARKEEVLGLTWGELNLEAGTLNLSRRKTQNASVIHLPADLVQELRQLRGDRIPEPAEEVFALKNIRAAWRAAVKDAGLEGKKGLTFHSTRHTFATKFLSDGGSVYELKEILGHSNIATTMKYLHMVDERVRKVMNGLSYGSAPAAKMRTHEAHPEHEGEKASEAGAA